MELLSKKNLLNLRLRATCRDSERLRTLVLCLGLTVDGMVDELLQEGWSDVEATQAVVDTLVEVQEELMSEVTS